MSRALNKGRELEGSRMSVAEVWDKADKKGRHGISKEPCLLCEKLKKRIV